jgi:FKBP-type peptidyl-prolyl cis-trans isomerase
MKKIALSLLIMSAILFSVSSLKSQQTMTDIQKMSYAVGYNTAEQLKKGFDIDQQAMLEGLKDGIAGKNQFTNEEMQQIFQLIQMTMQNAMNKEIEIEKEKGTAFLVANKKNKDVVETASGLQYKVVKMGNGQKPTASDKVKVHYHGTLIDGTVFDSSVDRGEPISFPLNGVIQGWTEGVQLMPIGSKFIFYIPSDLAYGDRGAGGAIKPGATLIFEVELLDIEK